MAFQPNDPDELGALWVKSGAKGDYMTGMINGVPVVVFPNTKKASDKAPDYRVLKSRPKGERPEREDAGLPSERAAANDKQRFRREAGPTDSEWE